MVRSFLSWIVQFELGFPSCRPSSLVAVSAPLTTEKYFRASFLSARELFLGSQALILAAVAQW